VRRTLSQFPDVVKAEIDLKKQRAIVHVTPSFDQYVALEAAIQEGGGAIRMFHTRYLSPQPVYAALGVKGLDPEKLEHLEAKLKSVPGVRAAFIDPQRWYTNEHGLDVGGSVVFADPNPNLQPRLIQAARQAGFIFEPKMHEQDEAADRQWSELNHGLSGFLILLLTAFGILQLALRKPPALIKYGTVYAWVGLFLFLFIRGDDVFWPLGQRSWWEGFSETETIQHRIGIGLLIPVLLCDFWRVRKGWSLNPSFSRWGILAIGMIGSTMLYNHLHTTLEPAHYAMVERMNAEHVAMGTAVLLFAVSKFVWDTWQVPRRWGKYLWLIFLGILGVMLNLYVE
jgi:hypothetical protein